MLKIAMCVISLYGCATYPRYVKKYECLEWQKKRLPDVTNNCIAQLQKQNSKRPPKEIAAVCYEIALKSLCEPKDYFERLDIFGNETAAIPCKYSITHYESYICDYAE